MINHKSSQLSEPIDLIEKVFYYFQELTMDKSTKFNYLWLFIQLYGVTHIFSPTIMLQSMDSSNIFAALLME